MTKIIPPHVVDNSEGTKDSPTVRVTLVTLSLSMLMASLSTSIANAGLPTLEEYFSASFRTVQWVVLGYLLAVTTFVVSAGRLGDLIGRRRLLLAGIFLFTTASFLCGISPTLWFLIAARATQGIGAAIMMTLSMALVVGTVPKEKSGRIMGLLGTMSAIGTTLGPALGGFLIEGLGWRYTFLIIVPLGILNLVLSHRYLPNDGRTPWTKWSHFDLPGTLALVLTLATYSLSMTLGRTTFGLLNVALLVAAGIGLGIFVRVESTATQPLIQVDLYLNRALRTNLVVSVIVSTVMMSTLIVGPYYLSLSLGLDTAHVGLALSVGPLVAALAGMPAGRIVDRYGARPIMIKGLTGMAAGSAALFFLPAAFSLAGYLGPIVCITFSYALFQVANNTDGMSGVPADQRGVISGMLNLSRNLGLITGASLMGAVFTHATSSMAKELPAAAAIATGMQSTFGVSATLIGLGLVLAHRTHQALGDVKRNTIPIHTADRPTSRTLGLR